MTAPYLQQYCSYKMICFVSHYICHDRHPVEYKEIKMHCCIHKISVTYSKEYLWSRIRLCNICILEMTATFACHVNVWKWDNVKPTTYVYTL